MLVEWNIYAPLILYKEFPPLLNLSNPHLQNLTASLLLHLGKPPSTETPYGPYPLVITPDSNPESKVLVVQAFAYGKYLGHLKVDFDDNGHVTSWTGNPIILNKSVPKDPTILQQIQQMKGEVTKLSEVRTISPQCY